MSKKTNTLWFVLGATVFNILVTLIVFVVLLVLYVRFLAPNVGDSESASWIFPVIFLGAIAASFFIYRFALKQVMKKVDMEKHFDPIFGRRRPPTRKD
jgi:hypothetical protein